MSDTNPEIKTIDNRTLPMGDNKYRTGILASGNNAVLGQVLGFLTASNKLGNTAPAKTDGAEFARVIAAHAVDASAGDKDITFFIEGDVDDALIVLDGGADLDTIVAGEVDNYRTMLRDYGILANTYLNDQVIDNS